MFGIFLAGGGGTPTDLIVMGTSIDIGIKLWEALNGNPQVLGLVLDMIGAFYVVKGFIFKELKRLLAESYGDDYKDLKHGMSGNLLRSFYKQSVEAKTGIVILISGFLFQIVGVVFDQLVLPSLMGSMLVLLTILVSIVFHYILFRPERLDNLEKNG